MSEIRAEPGEPCPACGTILQGRYCHDCGQDSLQRPRPLRDLASEAFSESNLIDGRTARTLATLAARPGKLLDAYRGGAGSLYATPVKIFVVMTTLFLVVLNFSDVVIYQYVRQVVPGQTVVATPDPDGFTVHVAGTTEQERWMQRRIEPSIDPAITAAMQAAADNAATPKDRANVTYEMKIDEEQSVVAENLASWLPNGLWLLMPLYALLLAPLFGRRRLFMEHAVFAMWAHALGFGLLILLALINKLDVGLPAWPLLIPYMIYFTVAARHYYGMNWVSASWRAVAHTALYVLLVLLPAAIIVYLLSMDMGAFIEFLNAP